MIKIERLSEEDYQEFTDMFLDYFFVDCDIKYDKDKLKENLIKKTILKQFERNLIFIDIAKEDNQCLGFIIYQIDKEESDWKERIGWGFVREFYIKKEFRYKGFGSKMLKNAEATLEKMGAKEIYLTSQEKDYVKLFYQKNGYTTNHNKATNGKEYFEKSL